jgi:hypothetical protein
MVLPAEPKDEATGILAVDQLLEQDGEVEMVFPARYVMKRCPVEVPNG